MIPSHLNASQTQENLLNQVTVILSLVILDGDFCKVGNSKAEWEQFRGRYYAQWFINKGDQSVRSLFSQLPGIFWFDRVRNLGSNSNQEAVGDSIKERSTGIYA